MKIFSSYFSTLLIITVCEMDQIVVPVYSSDSHVLSSQVLHIINNLWWL